MNRGVAAQGSRQFWVDHLRTFIIFLVVNMHACVTYSHVGSWYIKEGVEPATFSKLGFVFWQAHLQSFFMGLMFFLAGWFSPGSLESRGIRSFLAERGRRLGVPALVYMALLHPFMVFGLLGYPRVEPRPSWMELYSKFWASGKILSASGPLWFALALLAFSLVYALVHRTSRRAIDSLSPHPLTLTQCAAFVGCLAIGTFLARLYFPLGSDVLNFQLANFAQYIGAFAVGIRARKQGWLDAFLDSSLARHAWIVGLVLGPLFLALLLVAGGLPPPSGPMPYAGGWNSQAAGLAAWEQVTGTALGIACLHFFRTHVSKPTAMRTWLSDRAFGVYVFHAPILVALTLALRPLQTGAWLQMFTLTATGLIASFIVADLVRRIPCLRRFF